MIIDGGPEVKRQRNVNMAVFITRPCSTGTAMNRSGQAMRKFIKGGGTA